MKIEVLGSGCPNCQKLEQNAKKAVEELGLKNVKVEHVYDVNEMMERGITFSPAIMVDGEIKAEGRIPDVEEIKKWLK
jgi:small redox-active disulfide protein 2